MKNYLLVLFVLSLNQSFAQIRITGQIIDLQNNPIPSATINVVGLNSTGTSDNSGVFFLSLPDNIKKGDLITLRVSKQGYKATTKHTPASYLSIAIKLNKDLNAKKEKVSGTAAEPPKPETIAKVENQPTNVTSYFQSGGITAGQVIVAPPSRKLEPESSNGLLSRLPDKNEKIEVNCVMGDSEAFQFASEVSDFLKGQGYKNVNGVNQCIYNGPVFGQSVLRDSLGVKIVIGARQ